jgi:hypothetical protein
MEILHNKEVYQIHYQFMELAEEEEDIRVSEIRRTNSVKNTV